MHTSNRVHRKGGKWRGHPQAQTQRSNKSKPRPVVFQFLDPKGRGAARVALPGEVFAKLQAAANRAGLPIDQFMLRGLESQLRQFEAQLKAVNANNAGQGRGSVPTEGRAADSLQTLASATGDSADLLAQDNEGRLFLVHQNSRARRPITRTEAMRWIIDNYIPGGFEQDFERLLEAETVAGQGSDAYRAEKLGLDAKLAKALELICRWEQESVADYCRDCILAGMEASLDDMQLFARGQKKHVPKEERAWARQFYGEVKLLMNRKERRAV